MQGHSSKSFRRAETHSNPNLAYAVKLVHATCCLAGSPSYLDDIRADLHDCGISRAVRDHDTPVLFDWLVEALSFQGISDAVAAGYMDQHGSVCWAEIAEALSRNPSCPKLGGYWRFYSCRYRKGSETCSEPGRIDACPLPRHPLRNGRLNQMAYSLFLFMRDVAENDFVGWIDRQLGAVDPQSPDQLADPARGHYWAAAQRLWGGRQGLGDGVVVAAAERWKATAAVARSRCYVRRR
jgi:hypothetical protein